MIYMGVSTVDRTSRMYGTVIRVPSTVPVTFGTVTTVAGIRPVVNRILVNGRHTGLNMKPYRVNYHVQTCCCCGQRVLN